MKNAWKVFWTEDGKKRRKIFDGDAIWAEVRNHEFAEKPLEAAVAYAKELRKKGLLPELVSGRRAFIQKKDQLKAPAPGMTWCPYCVKWRHFQILRIRRQSYIGTPALRCPVCTISDEDFYVKKYNGKLGSLSADEIRRMHQRSTKNAVGRTQRAH
jgi:hypothetical protein